MYITEPQYKCNCSRGKIATLLLSVGQKRAWKIFLKSRAKFRCIATTATQTTNFLKRT